MDSKGHLAARKGLVDGTPVTNILLDTGCIRTMMREELVAENKLLPGEAVTVLCTHRDTVLYPLANVTIEVEEIKFPITAAVSMGLPVSVLLGTDVPSHCHRNQTTQWNPVQRGRKGVVRYNVQEGKSKTVNA